MHSHDDKLIPFKYGRALHEGIVNSELVELSDAGHTFFMSRDPRIADEICAFSAVTRQASSEFNTQVRVLATVMFNDIVGSTKLQIELGDELWRKKLGNSRQCAGSK